MRYLLNRGEVLTVEAIDAVEALTVAAGQAWITRSSDTRDYCLEAGDRLAIRKGEKLIVEALQETSVTVTGNESKASILISAVWAGRSPA
ncbi:MAG TPA: hypothetical protein DCZ75_04095 [Geobacter sp.]|nr:hypothetical protein [Geobacter sp.]